MKTLTSIAISLAVLLFVGSPRSAAWGVTYRLTVKDVEPGLDEIPVIAEISEPLAAGIYKLTPSGRQPAILAQVFEARGKHHLAMILTRVPQEKELVYSLDAAGASDFSSFQSVAILPRGRNLAIEIDHRLLTEYRVDAGNKPFFFPINGPSGASFTRAYPMESFAGEDRDHPHQRSCWFTHGKVNGIDFWSEAAGAGSIKETERVVIVTGPVLARLWTANDWLAPSGKKVCADERQVTFYRPTHARVVDFGFVIRADSGPVVVGETKEGMFGLRVASSMDAAKKAGGKITNAEGLTDEAAWGQASPWVDYVGPIDGRTVGIAILNHPESFRYPTNWHVRPYGLFAANPFGGRDFHKPDRGEYTIAAGQTIKFSYRVILHDGPTARAGLPAEFTGYSRPPRIELSAK
jgi:hypothetical protein